jgi:hypothetical protein
LEHERLRILDNLDHIKRGEMDKLMPKTGGGGGTNLLNAGKNVLGGDKYLYPNVGDRFKKEEDRI